MGFRAAWPSLPGGPQAGARALAPCLHSRVCPRREGGTGAVLGQLEQRKSPGWLGEVARQGRGVGGDGTGPLEGRPLDGDVFNNLMSSTHPEPAME